MLRGLRKRDGIMGATIWVRGGETHWTESPTVFIRRTDSTERALYFALRSRGITEWCRAYKCCISSSLPTDSFKLSLLGSKGCVSISCMLDLSPVAFCQIRSNSPTALTFPSGPCRVTRWTAWQICNMAKVKGRTEAACITVIPCRLMYLDMVRN